MAPPQVTSGLPQRLRVTRFMGRGPVPQGPDSLDPGPEPVSPPEPDFTADIYATGWSNESMDPPPPLSGQQNPDSVKHPPWGSIEQRLNPEFPLYLWSSLNMESPERLGASKRRSQGRRRDRSMDYPWIDASMSISPMEPPTSSRVPLGPDSLDPGPEPVSQPEPDFTADIFDFHRSNASMGPPPSFSGQQNPGFDFHRSNASMGPPPSFSRPQNPDCSRSLCSLLNVDSPERLGASMWSTRSMDPPISFR
ncbi:unnamed protein product [Pleuronectes platessa]|uniref:Uncharacterized protein n=1 Tax=Pleuronectes platessa TaxID=8262 RepID=A0A9N7V068_PLEPL|nr:unnamed protein product [Pleuronectes platessa]